MPFADAHKPETIQATFALGLAWICKGVNRHKIRRKDFLTWSWVSLRGQVFCCMQSKRAAMKLELKDTHAGIPV